MNNDADFIRKKRKRIGAIKRAIIIFMLLWMVTTLCISVYLIFKVNRLQKELEEESVRSESLYNGLKEALILKEKKEKEEEKADSLSENEEKKVYLTFDLTEPEEEDIIRTTESILSVLEEKGIKAAFFVNGTENEESLLLYKKIADDGHILGITSYSGGYDVYISKEVFREDVLRMSALVRDITGSTPVFYRFPGGSENKVINGNMGDFKEILRSMDIKFVDYNIYGNNVENILESVVECKTSVIGFYINREDLNLASEVNKLIEGLEKKENTDILLLSENMY